LRIFDCKVETCQEVIAEAPVILDFICDECREHFEKVKEYLAIFDIFYVINKKMVRGLDYYTQTAFEVITESLGAQNAVAGGGRYDGLIKELGGEDIPGIGFAIGIERLISMIPMKNENFVKYPHLFIAALGEDAQRFAFTLTNKLCMAGIRTEMDLSDKSLKSQMRRSNKLKCLYTLIIGQKEIEENKAELRNMKEGTQETVELDNIDNIMKIVSN